MEVHNALQTIFLLQHYMFGIFSSMEVTYDVSPIIGFKIMDMETTTIFQCIELCAAYGICKSCGYDVNSMSCTLFSGDIQTDNVITMNKTGYKLVERHSFPEVLMEVKKKTQCAMDDFTMQNACVANGRTCKSIDLTPMAPYEEFNLGAQYYNISCGIPCNSIGNPVATCGMKGTWNTDFSCSVLNVYQPDYTEITLQERGLHILGKSSLLLGIKGWQDCVIRFRPVSDPSAVTIAFGCGYARNTYCKLSIVGISFDRLDSAEMIETDWRLFWITWNATSVTVGRGCNINENVILHVVATTPLPEIGSVFLPSTKSVKEWMFRIPGK